jgi:RNA polymerase sigma factor (sigma-70 family)
VTDRGDSFSHTIQPTASTRQERLTMTTDEIALGRFARALINRKVRKLAGYWLFPDMDEADLTQELTLRLLAGLRRFDPSHPPNAYVATILERAADMLVRSRLAAKRDRIPTSLNAEGAAEPSDPFAKGEAEQADRDIDVAEALAALPPEMRSLAELLMRSQNVSEAARRQGVARSSLVRQVERLRKHLEDGGLEVYLP